MSREDNDFERVTARLRESVLAACEPIESDGISGPRYVYVMGALFCELSTMQISFLAENGLKDFARKVLEGAEEDLVELRKKYGWLNG